MKKTLITITMLTLVFAMVLTGNVNAAAVTASAPAEPVKEGDTVVVTIKPDENLTGLSFDLSYNPEFLEYASHTAPAALVETNPVLTEEAPNGEITFGIINTTAIDMTVTVTFKALKATESAEVSVDNITVIDANDEKTNLNASTATVVISGEAVEEPPVEDPGTEEPGTEEPGTDNSGETGTNDPKPGIPQTGANVFAYVVSGIVLVAVLALVVKTKKD